MLTAKQSAQRRWVQNILYAALGIGVFLLIYGPVSLDVTYDGWILNGYVETDIVQRYAGWLAYRNADSFFPLTFSSLISFPFGDYTSLADSIPLAEIFFKLLSPILPSMFQFCGLLCCFNLAMQALCSSWVLRRFFHSEWAVFAGSLVFCLSPVMLERMFRHTSLSFHWLILLAILFYLKREEKYTPIKFAVLGISTIWLHSYFLPMLMGFFLAAILDALRTKSVRWTHWAWFFGTAAGAAASMKFLGILGLGVGNTSGYGQMGMNLNALFNPVSLDTNWWVPGGGKMHWSAFLPMRTLAANNIESFNYLGLGVLLSLVVLAIFVVWRCFADFSGILHGVQDLVKRHLFLLLFAAFSTVFAVSNVVCAFSHELFCIPLPQWLLSLFNPFRASGRLFWPVNYLLVLTAVLFWKRIFQNKRMLAMALSVLVLVQAADLAPVLLKKHREFAQHPTYTRQEQDDAFLQAVGTDDTVFFLELRDDRALCASLLKEGKASNLWLISRDEYGLDRSRDAMEQAVQALKQGHPPYENCTYVTQNVDLAAEICENPGFSSRTLGEDILIKHETD